VRRGLLAVAVGLAAGAALVAIREALPKHVAVRPLVVQVVDAGTGRPLPGIRVHRLCETERYTFRNPMDPSGHGFLLSTFETDAEGRARLPRLELSLSRHDYLTAENVYVNLDVAEDYRGPPGAPPAERLWWAVLDASSPGGAASVETPAAAWRGYVIHSVEGDAYPGWQKGAERPRYDVLWNERGLARREQAITVGLRRQPGPAPR